MITAVCVAIVKARRKTATAEDLLFAGASDGSHLAAVATNPVVMSARVDPAVLPARCAAVVEPGGSPPERDYSLAPPTRPATARVNRYYMQIFLRVKTSVYFVENL